jgi:hypothetical protein
LGFKEPQEQLARWMEELSQYDMVIKHRPGKNHRISDGLSRIVEDEVSSTSPPNSRIIAVEYIYRLTIDSFPLC